MGHRIGYIIVFLVLQGVVWGATVEEVRTELDELVHISTKESNNMMDAFNSAASILKSTQSGVLRIGDQYVRSEFDRLKVQFDHVLDSAAAMGVNITACTNNQWHLMLEIRQIGLLHVIDCSNGFANAAQTAIDVGQTKISAVVEEVFTLEQKLPNCKADTACLSSLLVEIKFAQKDVPRRMVDEFEFAANKAEANTLRLMQCEVDPAVYMVRYGSNVILQMKKCADKIIDGNRNATTS